jgi:hypothetical protein
VGGSVLTIRGYRTYIGVTMNTMAFTTSPIDNDILITLCQPGRAKLCRLSVDDFDDPEEAEIITEEIHLTVVGRDARGREDPIAGCCFKMSTVSAAFLIDRLREAIQRRQDPWEGVS